MEANNMEQLNPVFENRMEVVPLKSLDALLSWECPGHLKKFLESLPKLAPQSPPISTDTSESVLSSSNFQTLICHDFKGGYLDDRFCYGTRKMDAYRFYHWPAIDTFVYFSHHFITIPPCGWVHSAHIHGVKILGTIITEWKHGESICEALLSDNDIIELTIQNLVEIAWMYKFDGWLINIENKIKPEDIHKLVYFVSELNKRMHQSNPHAQVIWYDAVTKDGELKWQNELNENNQCFFDVCDGIFLNYTWKEENLKKSAANSGQRISDVYVGIDVFGRNMFGGGGFNCHKALEIIRKCQLSTAIFAQGWTYQVVGSDNFFKNDNDLWETLEKFLLYHGPANLPLRTSFCQGYGKNYFSEGKIAEEGEWYNLSRQQIQPLWEEFCRVTPLLNVSTDEAFNGGSCLVVWLDAPTFVRMMVCRLDARTSLSFTIVYKVVGNVKSISFVFTVEDEIRHDTPETNSTTHTSSELCFVAEECNEKDEAMPEKRATAKILPESKKDVNGWTVKQFVLPSREGWIRSFGMRAEGPALVKFGELSIEHHSASS